MLSSAGWVVAVIPAALIVFVIAAFVLRRHPQRVRAFYLLLMVFVGVLLAMSAVGGVSRAVGLAISDPRSSVGDCSQFETDLDLRPTSARVEAQGPPEPPRPPTFTFPPTTTLPPEFRERLKIPIPTIVAVTPPPPPDFGELPDVPAPVQVECPLASGRKAAAPLAARSGALLLGALGLIWWHARPARTMLDEEEEHGR